jgi:hypothetical protein
MKDFAQSNDIDERDDEEHGQAQMSPFYGIAIIILWLGYYVLQTRRQGKQKQHIPSEVEEKQARLARVARFAGLAASKSDSAGSNRGRSTLKKRQKINIAAMNQEFGTQPRNRTAVLSRMGNAPTSSGIEQVYGFDGVNHHTGDEDDSDSDSLPHPPI